MAKKPEQESFYEVHLNKHDELMFSIRAGDDEPASPVLLYDGGPHALLYRTPQSSVLLDFIHPDVCPYLMKAKQVLIAETRDYQVVREYWVACKHVKNLPIDESGVKPLLTEDEARQVDERDLYK